MTTIIWQKFNPPEYEYIRCERCGGEGVVEVDFQKFMKWLINNIDYTWSFKEIREFAKNYRKKSYGRWVYYIDCPRCYGEGRI
jgi:hypothetical protein